MIIKTMDSTNQEKAIFWAINKTLATDISSQNIEEIIKILNSIGFQIVKIQHFKEATFEY